VGLSRTVEPPAAEPKLGLALSGGGHRAAFFHIGVLGALAELGLLRRVRVLSTVSGGSCVGALYYLHVKRLLEETADNDLTDLRYVEVVRKVALEYQAAAAKNLLALAYLRPWLNFKMALRSYSRTERAGELLEEHFYGKAWNGELCDGRIRMRDLLISPVEGAVDPDSAENAKRNGPVPILLLEATTLNTGHNWRFEAGYMGEPDRQSDVTVPGRQGDPTDVDKNETLLRSKWSDLPEPLRDFPLGRAVAASAAFPGGFMPVQIKNLYPGLVVDLTDGGVHDNQGVEGLVNRGCTHIVISDGSGQMKDVDKPGTWVPKVLSRVVSIYGDTEREQRLLRAIAEDEFAFFHLQSGLPNRIRFPGGTTIDVPPRMTTSDFGVDQEAQKRLAGVRTNLDAFSELEAWALAKDGHAIAAHVTPTLRPAVAALGKPLSQPVSWPWDDVDLVNPTARLLSVLAKGKREILGLFLPLFLMAVAAIVLVGYCLHAHGWVIFGIAVGVLVALVLYVAPEVPFVSAFLYEVVMPAVLAIPFFVAAVVLWIVGRRWLHYGRLSQG
jgi:predicted acylesterase/phospholipase RssA